MCHLKRFTIFAFAATLIHLCGGNEAFCLTCEQSTFDFCAIPSGAKTGYVTHAFTIRNNSLMPATNIIFQAPYGVQAILAGEGYIDSGETGIVNVAMSLAGRSGRQCQLIRVYPNGHLESKCDLLIKGFIGDEEFVKTLKTLWTNDVRLSQAELQKPGQAEVACSSPIIDIGVINETNAFSHVFRIQNIGTAPLEILQVRGCCGSFANTDKGVVLPGEYASISVRLNFEGRMGKQNRTIAVLTSDVRNPLLMLTVKGEIVRGQ